MLKARNVVTGEEVAVKKMSFMGRQSEEVSDYFYLFLFKIEIRT